MEELWDPKEYNGLKFLTIRSMGNWYVNISEYFQLVSFLKNQHFVLNEYFSGMASVFLRFFY